MKRKSNEWDKSQTYNNSRKQRYQDLEKGQNVHTYTHTHTHASTHIQHIRLCRRKQLVNKDKIVNILITLYIYNL